MRPPQDDNAGWPLTLPDLINAAAENAGSSTDAISVLAERYDGPLKMFLRSAFRDYPKIKNAIEDRLQDFYVTKLLRPGWLKHFNPEVARFRTFLAVASKNHVKQWWRTQPEYKEWKRTQKKDRDEGELLKAGLVHSIDFEVEDLPDVEAEQAVEVAWLQAVIEKALEMTRSLCAKSPKHGKIYRLLTARVVTPILENMKPPGFAELCREIGFCSPTEAQNALTTGKRILVKLIIKARKSAGLKSEETEREAAFLDRLIRGLEAKNANGKQAG